MASKNERNTENIVRETLRKLGYYDQSNDIQIEEQKSNIEAVKRALKTASKKGKGTGAPEFIISDPNTPDFLVIVECKAALNDHVSAECAAISRGESVEENAENIGKRTARYAVDGVLHYAAHLSKEFNIVAVALSGEAEFSTQFSAYLHPKGAGLPKELRSKSGQLVDRFLSWKEFIEHATFDPMVQRLRHDELMAFSRELHEFMRDHAKLTESQKPLLVSGTLIALQNTAFELSYDKYKPEDLQKEWMSVIKKEIDKATIPQAKKENMAQPFSGIAVHPELGKSTKAFPKGVLHELIRMLNEKVWPFISIYHDFDVVGQFYGEFLKYTGGDKKALGIVLTPRHITELCARLANVNAQSKVLDICAGTGGFLISAMHQMMRDAQTDAERDAIRNHGLIGIEQQPEMFTLCASNMILRGDGKANLHQGSCFDEAIFAAVKQQGCDVALLNPPFSQSDADLHELRFVRQALDALKKGGTAIAVAPMSCAISPNSARAELLKNHTLEAVMSLPDELFYPVGTIACLMVFKAHVPHEKSNVKTWFGYWKDDGYTKTKHRGRVDLDDLWAGTRDRWVEMFRNREVHVGESVTHKVGASDEWCAEAYMETDYGVITAADFELTVRNYAIFRLLEDQRAANTEASALSKIRRTIWFPCPLCLKFATASISNSTRWRKPRTACRLSRARRKTTVSRPELRPCRGWNRFPPEPSAWRAEVR